MSTRSSKIDCMTGKNLCTACGWPGGSNNGMTWLSGVKLGYQASPMQGPLGHMLLIHKKPGNMEWAAHQGPNEDTLMDRGPS